MPIKDYKLPQNFVAQRVSSGLMKLEMVVVVPAKVADSNGNHHAHRIILGYDFQKKGCAVIKAGVMEMPVEVAVTRVTEMLPQLAAWVRCKTCSSDKTILRVMVVNMHIKDILENGSLLNCAVINAGGIEVLRHVVVTMVTELMPQTTAVIKAIGIEVPMHVAVTRVTELML